MHGRGSLRTRVGDLCYKRIIFDRYINWDVDQETFYVKSTLKKAPFTQQVSTPSVRCMYSSIIYISSIYCIT